MTQQAKDKLTTYRLMQIYDDLVAAQRAAASGAPVPALTSGSCLPETVLLHVIFSGDEKPLQALASEPLYPTDPSPQNGLRDAVGHYMTTRLVELAALSNVQSIDERDPGQTTLNYSAEDIQVGALRAEFPWMTGAGTTVVVLDTGIEWRHAGFKTNGKTRIKRYWDIAAHPARPGEPQGPGGLGVLYNEGWINDTIAGSRTIRSTKSDLGDPSHGTGVSGVAAGNGAMGSCTDDNCCRFSGVFVGIAPEADIIAVKLRNLPDVRPALLALAADTSLASVPMVANISVVTHDGPHDGTDDVEKAIDTFSSRPGRIVVVGAGNDGCRSLHVHGIAAAAAAGGNPGTVEFVMHANADDNAPRTAAFFLLPSPQVTVTLAGPGGPPLTTTIPGPTRVRPSGGIFAQIGGVTQSNGEVKVGLRIVGPGASGDADWTVRFQNTGATDVAIDGWITAADPQPGDCGAAFKFTGTQVTSATTIAIPASAKSAISVGAYENKTSCFNWSPSGDISSFSSRGPIRGHNANNATDPRPTLTAPGRKITTTAYDSCKMQGHCCASWWPECLSGTYDDVSGTSIAAPHVAGAIAVMLQVDPTMTRDTAVAIFKDNSRPPPTNDPSTWGFGKLDVNKAVAAALKDHLDHLPPQPHMMMMAAPGAVPTPAIADAPAQPTFALLTRGLRTTGADGELLAGLVSRHFSEARRLINSSTKVATMWHRAHGPALLAEVAKRARAPKPGAPLLGDSDQSYFRKFLDQLSRAGSDRLKSAIDQYGGLVMGALAAS